MPFSFNFLPIEIYKFSDRNDEWSTQNHISPIGTDTLWQMHLRHTVAIDINWMAFFFIYMNRNKWNKTRPSLITTIATQNHTNHFRISIQITISISIIICDIRNLPAAENELHDLAFTDRAKEVNVFLLFFFLKLPIGANTERWQLANGLLILYALHATWIVCPLWSINNLSWGDIPPQPHAHK